ncbi:MAG: 16S rRNA processing protein RimM [Bacteroidales bacterium]|nr:16S rRNA processing protein RimM [Bacteroidales bacterium]
MKKEDCFYLGKIVKPFSYKGDLVLFFDVDEPMEYVDLAYVYLEINKRLVKYDIETMRPHQNKMVARFVELTEDEAAGLVGKEMYLPLEFLPKLDGNKFYYHEVIGFSIEDSKKGNLGTIREIFDNMTQPLMAIDHDGKEILIPIIDEVIKEVCREEKLIKIEAPEGLIDIYLE